MIYMNIGVIYKRIFEINSQENNRPDFIDVINDLYSKNEFCHEATKTQILEELSAMDDNEFIEGTKELWIPFYFSDNTKVERNVPEYIPWDNEVVSIYSFPGISKSLNTLPGFLVVYVYKGSCVLNMESETKILKQGDLIIVPPGNKTSISESDTNEESFSIPVMLHPKTFGSTFFSILNRDNILSDFFSAALEGKTRLKYLLFSTKNNFSMKNIAKMLFLEQFYTDQYRENCSDLLLKLLFSTALRLTASGNKISTSSDIGNITSVLIFIQENYRTVTMRQLSYKYNYSESYLSELILKYTGNKFTDLVKNLKIKEAKHLLINTMLSVKQISKKVGYGSSDHFTRVFKKEIGITPLKFRNNAKQLSL